jgi:hypothetical protein
MVQQVKKIKLFIIACSVFLTSCQNANNSKPKNILPDFEWLVGKWINNQDSTALFFENWTKNDAGDFNGKSYILAHHDTVFFESIKLHSLDSGTYYSVSVRNQNLSDVVHFKLVSSANQTFVFENKKHDFPQSITYQYKAPDTLNAWIEGLIKGELKKETFLMWRNH